MRFWETVSYPEIEEIKGIIGDSDGDSVINVVDVTTLQMHLARILTEDDLRFELCDCDKDGFVKITDATLIQMYLAHIDIDFSFVGTNK